MLLVPAGDQAPAGRLLPPDDERLVLAAGDAAEDACSVPAADAQLIETPACGLYLCVRRATAISGGGEAPAEVAPGLYQLIHRQG